MTKAVELERSEERYVTIWLDNRHHYNALSDEMMIGISDAIDGMRGDPHCRAIVIRGRGGVFCAGRELRDVQALQRSDVSAVEATYLQMRRLNETVYRSPLPVISLIEKYAFGGGMMLASWSDIAIAESDAMLGYPEVFNGITPWAAIPSMVQGMPMKVTMDLVLTGRHVPAEEARRMGLITRVVAKAELENELQRTLDAIYRGSPAAVAKTRQFIWQCSELLYQQGIEASVEKAVVNINAPELVEGIAAFLEKRRPVWPK